MKIFGRYLEHSKLFCEAMSDAVADSLVKSGALSQELLFWLVEQRDSLGKSSIQVGALLFTTLAILTLVMFGKAKGEELQLLGIKIDDPTLFVFLGLVLGNLLYVISTGLFIKGIAYEFLLRTLTKVDHFKLGVTAGGFIASHPGNMLTYATESGIADRAGSKAKRLIGIMNLYMKYILVVCYGIFFYTVLGIFLWKLWIGQSTSWANILYFWVLIVLNIMAGVASFVIFLPVREQQNETG
jgi:hypothetical protein